ncbi:Uncharacterized protein TCM_033261 [Theobroma cacao]|uniref:DNA/RNA polymerases superfamily protein n=1 Tax=Theobroma cacao TaxID=3641 RepID=A0A061FHW8_THECC|nr:Uncharacterized protein TCM_033261 [Theobroma cacao]
MYNNNFQSSIGMAPYEALYGRKCRTPLCWDEVGERKLFNVELIDLTNDKIKVIRERLKIAQDRQKSYSDRRRKDLEFEVDDKVFLKVVSLPIKARKLHLRTNSQSTSKIRTLYILTAVGGFHGPVDERGTVTPFICAHLGCKGM